MERQLFEINKQIVKFGKRARDRKGAVGKVLLAKINKKILISLVILIFAIVSVNSQTPSMINHIRINVWADVDAYPGLADANDYEDFEYPIKCIKETAPFLINGMVYGWEFSYTPSDKTRGVEEYFEVSEIVPEEVVRKKIKYSSPWIDDNLFRCWVDFDRDEYQVRDYYRWNSINNPLITGRGYGDLRDGFQGIVDASKDALKNAIRDYFRGVIKNKPKEIRGKVLIKGEPSLGVDAGRYVFNLDFFLECGKIVEYKVF